MSKAIPSWLTGRLLPKSSHVRVPAPTSRFLDWVPLQLRPSSAPTPSITPWRYLHNREHLLPLPGGLLHSKFQGRGGSNSLRWPTGVPISSSPSSAFRHVDNLVNTANEYHSRRLLQWRTYSSDSKRDAAKDGSVVSSRQSNETRKDGPRNAESSSTSKAGDGSTEAQGKEGLEAESLTSSVSKYLNLSRIPHRPTKEELLAAATNFRQRLKVRFKWMSIRSMRPWNADEWGAFVSWFMLGHLVWILVGTTTFFSLVILSINTVFAQGKQQERFFATLKNRKYS